MVSSNICLCEQEEWRALINRTLFFLVTALGFLVLNGCGTDRKPTLRVAFSEDVPSQIIHLIKNKEFDTASDLNLLPSPTTSAAEVLRLFKNEIVDVATMGLHDAIPLAKSNEIVIVGVLGRAIVSRTLIARPNFTTVSSLGGAKIGVQRGNHRFVNEALATGGLSLEDVELIYTPYLEGESWLTEGRIDAFVSIEPQITRLRRAGMNVLYDRQHTLATPVRVLITRSDVVEQNDSALLALAHSWQLARKYMVENPEEVSAFLGPKIGLSIPEFQGLVDRFEFNKDYLSGESYDLLGELRKLQDIFARDGIAPPDSDTSTVRLYWEI